MLIKFNIRGLFKERWFVKVRRKWMSLIVFGENMSGLC